MKLLLSRRLLGTATAVTAAVGISGTGRGGRDTAWAVAPANDDFANAQAQTGSFTDGLNTPSQGSYSISAELTVMAGSRANEAIMQMFISKRLVQSVTRCLAVAVLTVAGLSVSASAAHASASTTCTGSSAISYSPGLTNTPQTVNYSETDTYSSCTSTDTSLTAGSSSTNITLPGASCNGGGIFPPSSYTISWNNGQSSTMSLTFTDVIIGGTEQVTGAGTVTWGEFTGGAATIVWLYPLLNPLLCATSQGVTSQNGTVAAQILVVP